MRQRAQSGAGAARASRLPTSRRGCCAACCGDKGYSVHGWGLGANVGPHPHVLDGMERRLTELFERYGAKVSLVGWSLGGIYARELAREPLRSSCDSSSRSGARTASAPVIAVTRRSCTRRSRRSTSRSRAGSCRRRSSPPLDGAGDVDLLADRRDRAVAGLRRAGRTAAREHRRRRHPQRARLQRRRALCRSPTGSTSRSARGSRSSHRCTSATCSRRASQRPGVPPSVSRGDSGLGLAAAHSWASAEATHASALAMSRR